LFPIFLSYLSFLFVIFHHPFLSLFPIFGPVLCSIFFFSSSFRPHSFLIPFFHFLFSNISFSDKNCLRSFMWCVLMVLCLL
jgi:hypothetical protein